MDHDQLFKQLLTTFFVEFLELFLPEGAAYVRRDGIEFLDKEVFTDLAAGERHEVDLLAKVRFEDREAFFLVHVENQSSAREAFARRMFRYFARLHDRHDLPVYPIALLSYDAPRRPEPDRYRVAFPDRAVLDFNFRAIQLNRLNWRDFIDRPNPVANALMAKMRIAPGDRPRVKLECLRMMARLKLDRARSGLIRNFMDTYLRLSGVEEKAYNEQLKLIAPDEQEAVMNISNQWEEKGEARGVARGLIQGGAEFVLRKLRRRLGELPAALQDRVRQLPPERLDELDEAMSGFKQPDDAQAWLDSRG